MNGDIVSRLHDQPALVASSRVKRLFDIVIAITALVFLMPLLLLVALLIIVESRGPVLFRQRRTGLNGREFLIFKFRSMKVMEDGAAVRQASRGDARVTRVGGLLRRSSIDELPQLLNILRGDMSLVGPRPHAIAHSAEFTRLIPDYPARYRTRPGLTGLAQANGLRGEIHSKRDIAMRVAKDIEYIETWSLALDAVIVARTLFVVSLQRTAY